MIQSLTPDTTKTLNRVFISSWLDYCNSLLFGVADQQPKRLQSVQNAACRLVSGTCSDHITPVLKVLHWLPVRQCIQYKMAMLVHKCLNEHAPEYLITDCCWAGSRRSGTCSAGRQMLEVVRMNTFVDVPLLLLHRVSGMICLMLSVTLLCLGALLQDC